MEALSNLIQLFRMRVAVYHNAQICGNWLYHEGHLGQTCFHMVTKEACRLDVPGHLKTVLNKGDMVIFPKEIPHTMYPVQESDQAPFVVQFHLSDGQEGTGMLCGQACFDHLGSQYLLDALPEVFLIRYRPELDWCKNLVDLIMAESLQPNIASAAIIDRLSELLFVYALRQHLLDTQGNTNVLSLYGDTYIHKAITAIHQNPANNWTLGELAKQSGMSRTAFAKRFKDLSDWTPIKYLTWWRMQLAWQHLTKGMTSAEVSLLIGYQSEAAFSRAFQKQFGTTAGRVRRTGNQSAISDTKF